MSAILGIRPGALAAWRDLHNAITDSSRPTPCRAEPDVWSDPPTAELAEMAASLCTRCPVITHCRLFADLNRERAGVWAGANRTPRPGRKPNPERQSA